MANYSFLPELQGITQMQQQGLADQFRQARSGLKRSFSRTPMQSSGAYFGAMGDMNAKEATGMENIERENMYKNAMLGREERMVGEGRDWQNTMADANMRRQLEMMRTQRGWQQEDMLGQAFGSLVGMGASAGLGWIGNATGWNMNPIQKNQFDWMSKPENADRIGETFGLY